MTTTTQIQTPIVYSVYMDKSIPGKALVAELIQLKEKTSWSWETISRELQRVMGKTGPSKTTLLRYATGKVKQRNLMVERYIQEAIHKLKMKLVEEQLAESEVRFRELVENAKDLIYRYRLKPRPGYEYISPVCKEMLGYTPEEFYADPKLALKVTHPDDRKMLEQFLQGEGQFHERATLRWVHRDGRELWIERLNVPIYNEAGTLVAIEGIARDVTEHKVAEATAANLAAMVTSTNHAIMTSALDGSITSWNAGAERLFGYTAEEVIGRTTEFLHPAGQPDRYSEMVERVMKGEQVEYSDTVRLSKDGQRIHLSLSIFPTKNQEGQIIGSAGIAQDITQYQRTEAAMQSIVNAAVDGIITIDKKGIIQSFNPAATRIFGYSPDEVIDQNISILMPEPDRSRHDGYMNNYLGGGKPKIIGSGREVIGKRKDGTTFPMDLAISKIHLESEVGFTGIVRDISARIGAETELRESHQRYHNLFENAPDMMAVIEYPSGKILECNQTLVAGLGYSKEEIVGRLWVELYHPESREIARETFASFGKSGDISWKERTLLRADGNTIPVLVQAVPIPDETGKVVATQVTWRNIRDLKETEKALAQKQEELFASQKMETIGTLAGGIAHDFNNLLTGIRGYTQLLLERMGTGSAESQDLLEILKCADRAADLTRGLLTFSRREVSNPTVLNLNSVIEDTCKIIERLIGENIELEFVPATDLDNVRADPGQIEQVLLNLAVNARDAMPDGGSFKITTTNVTVDPDQLGKDVGVKAGRYVALFETDSGCGMDEVTQQRIFEPFFTTKDVGKGTGLGLSVVYGIVQEHEGYLWVNSQPGWGTTFTIYLHSTDEEVEELSPKATPESMPKGSEVILVAEDEPPVRKVVGKVLERLGYTVLCAEHARKAEELLNAHDGEIHLLLSDVMMPGENGPALYDKLRVKHPSLKVLFMSGYAENSGGLISDAPFLGKPFTQEILAQKVREVLDSKKTSRIQRQ